jgi:hypothetical protein
MAFDPNLLPPVATSLCSNLSLDKEARTRSAVGRAYYALFLGIRAEVCRQHGKNVDSGVQHGTLKDDLYAAGANGRPELTALAKLLSDVYDARRQADYKLVPAAPYEKELAKPAFADNLTKQVSAALRKLPTMDLKVVACRA